MRRAPNPGEKLQSALERRDAEELSLLRATHETALNETILAIREQQIEEARAARAALEAGRAALETRIAHYGSIPRMNASEAAAVVNRDAGIGKSDTAATLQLVAAYLSAIPNFSFGLAGFGGSPTFSLSVGGSTLAAVVSNHAARQSTLASIEQTRAAKSDNQGRFTREFASNQFQRDLAQDERDRLESEIVTAQLREAIAAAERDRQQQQFDDATAVEEFLKTKYTDYDLYDWMVKQISLVYFQAYQIAFDAAQQAEDIYRFELADQSAMFIQFGYWDSLKKGLLAPERLTNDLRRMESDYLNRHSRGLEITKHVSLAQTDPLALLTLKLTGSADIELPEWLFDLDYPGHYLRRLKSAAISIPCVVGPYTSINCTISSPRTGSASPTRSPAATATRSTPAATRNSGPARYPPAPSRPATA
ncbi:hypothetical protein GCM10029992_50760 [Glycomyces albus]